MKQIITGILALIALAAPGAPAAAQVAVVANESVPVKTIDNRMLLDIYTGDIKLWSGGVPVVPVDLRTKSDVKDAFYGFLGMSVSRLKSIWMKNMLAGEGNPPESIGSEDELIERVANTRGAIGYVSIPKARAARAAGVSVVTLLEIPEAQ